MLCEQWLGMLVCVLVCMLGVLVCVCWVCVLGVLEGGVEQKGLADQRPVVKLLYRMLRGYILHLS